MLSLGRLRRALQPVVLRYWLKPRTQKLVQTRVEGMKLEVFPGVFHPRYFGSSSILARFVGSIPLREKSFLEVGCGTGIVALCAARAGASVTAVDINPEAARCTIANAARNGLRIDVQISDVFSAIEDSCFDVIAWNPPFLSGTPTSFAEGAFYGGNDFDVIRKFAKEVEHHLNQDGVAYTILSGDIEIDRVETIFRENGLRVSQALAKRWGLGETMIVLCARR
jgi:release factor glutamine methyltransferase